MPWLYELTRPVAFLTAKGPTLRLYRDWLPLGGAVAGVAAYAALPVDIKLVGPDSASAVMSPLFAGLPGFFIAALAAVSTFQGGDLDRDMARTTIWISVNGDSTDTPVTLRVFLSHLFAYLTVLAVLGFLLCGGATLLASNMEHFKALAHKTKTPLDDSAWFIARNVFIFTLAIITNSVLTCTSLGLYFLAERIHQELS